MDEKTYLAPNGQSHKFDKLTEGIWSPWLKNITIVLQEGRYSKWMEQFTDSAPTYGEDGGTWRELLTTLRANETIGELEFHKEMQTEQGAIGLIKKNIEDHLHDEISKLVTVLRCCKR
jgi:hypothetical protein